MGINGGPYISEDAKGLEGTVDKSGREEGEEQENAVIKLCPRASHVDLIKEPVNIQEGRR